MSFAENVQSAERSTVKNLYNCAHREVKDVITMSFSDVYLTLGPGL